MQPIPGQLEMSFDWGGGFSRISGAVRQDQAPALPGIVDRLGDTTTPNDCEMSPQAQSGMEKMRARIRARMAAAEAQSADQRRAMTEGTFGVEAIDRGSPMSTIRLPVPEWKNVGVLHTEQGTKNQGRLMKIFYPHLEETRRQQALVIRNPSTLIQERGIPYVAASELLRWVRNDKAVDILGLIKSMGGALSSTSELPREVTMAVYVRDEDSQGPTDIETETPRFTIKVSKSLGPTEQRAAAAMALGRLQMGMPLGPFSCQLDGKEMRNETVNYAIRDMLTFASVLLVPLRAAMDPATDKWALCDELAVPFWLINFRRYGCVHPTEEAKSDLAKLLELNPRPPRAPAVAGGFECVADDEPLILDRTAPTIPADDESATEVTLDAGVAAPLDSVGAGVEVGVDVDPDVDFDPLAKPPLGLAGRADAEFVNGLGAEPDVDSSLREDTRNSFSPAYSAGLG